MQSIMSALRQQSTQSGIVLLAVVVLLARAAGVDLGIMAEDIAKDMAALAAAVGVMASAAKIVLPDAPPAALPPESAIEAAVKAALAEAERRRQT